MEEPLFSGKNRSLKDYLTNDLNKESYNKMYAILQNGLTRLQRQRNNASTKDEATEIGGLIETFENGLFLLERASLFIASQTK